MARTIAQIQAAIVAAKTADATLSAALTSSSMTAIWLLWTWVIATAQWLVEVNFDNHKSEVQGLLNAQKKYLPQWYVTMALAFQYGDALAADSDTYAVIRPAGDPAFVVTYAVAVELPNEVRVKLATGTPGNLAAIGAGPLAAINQYFKVIKPAGVRVVGTSGNGDNLQTGMIIYYDPLVLTATGARIDGTNNTPVLNAINAFLAALPFNGIFDYNSFVNALQPENGLGGVAGVIVADVSICQANYGTTPYVDIISSAPSQYTPDSGYLVLDAGYFAANIVYVPYV